MHTHSIVRNIVALSALACLACAPAAHAQVKLDFENLSNPSNSDGYNFQGTTITQNGFTIGSIGVNGVNKDIFYSWAPGIVTTASNYTGSVALYDASTANAGTSAITLTQNSGAAFTINAISIANFTSQSYSPGGITVTFTGNKQGGGTVTQQFQHGANNNLETLMFGSSFTNLSSVSIRATANNSFYLFQFDNIVLNTPAAVPEPGSVALLFGAVVTGAGFVRRGRGKRCVR